jgi:uncharacterized protein with HEPN domain
LDEEIRGRLQDILDVETELTNHLRGATRSSFRGSKLLQRVAERLLEIAGEAANHVPPEVTEGIDAGWRALRSMRVLLAHAYHRVDVDILWTAATADLPRFADTVRVYLESET